MPSSTWTKYIFFPCVALGELPLLNISILSINWGRFSFLPSNMWIICVCWRSWRNNFYCKQKFFVKKVWVSKKKKIDMNWFLGSIWTPSYLLLWRTYKLSTTLKCTRLEFPRRLERFEQFTSMNEKFVLNVKCIVVQHILYVLSRSIFSNDFSTRICKLHAIRYS